MGFFDFLRDKQDTSPELSWRIQRTGVGGFSITDLPEGWRQEEIRERITEIRMEIRAEEVNLDQELAQRLRNRFETLWQQSRDQLVQGFPDQIPVTSPPSETSDSTDSEGSSEHASDSAVSPPIDPPHAHLRDALWELWERTRGRCQKCERSRGISFYATGTSNTPASDRVHLLCSHCQLETSSS